MNIPIVVVAYCRNNTLKRILTSLSKAHYPGGVTLIISIDGGGPGNVIQVAKEFVWEHGQKEIIQHNNNLGLRKHILSCGAISQKYDGIVLLEDDLYVSPWFYDYVLNVSEYYQASPEVSGIALYSPRYNETAFLPFYPLNDGYDVFFMQLACSWGQIWLREQWKDFEKWYEDNEKLANDQMLPLNVKIWPKTSWKKYFIKYMISKNKYFVYPRHSYTTNFGDKGQHHEGVKKFQVPLIFGAVDTFKFVEFKDSNVKYDAFCEIDSDCLKKLSENLSAYDFVVDFYGTKERHHYDKSYVVTSKKCSEFFKSFDKSLIPIECNVIESIPGDKLFFAKVKDVNVDINMNKYVFLKANDINEHKYYYSIDDLNFQIQRQKLVQPILNSYSSRIMKKFILLISIMKRFVKKSFGTI